MRSDRRCWRTAGLLLFFCFRFFSAGACAAEPAEAKVGVLVLAHGGDQQWNAEVENAVRNAHLDQPVEINFGMGMMPNEVDAIQQAVDRLEKRGAASIIAVPLLVSSYSSVYRQYEYLFGLRKESSWPEHRHAVRPLRIHPGISVRLGRALDDSPLVAQILLERSIDLSKDPSREAIVIVAHGPETEQENEAWLSSMEALGEKVRQFAGYAAVAVATLQDDAPAKIRDAATKQFREQVASLSVSYRVIVVPLLLSQGGIEKKIPKRLEGLSYAFSGETLLPSPQISLWLKQQVDSQRSGAQSSS